MNPKAGQNTNEDEPIIDRPQTPANQDLTPHPSADREQSIQQEPAHERAEQRNRRPRGKIGQCEGRLRAVNGRLWAAMGGYEHL